MKTDLPIIPPSLFGRCLLEENDLEGIFEELVLLPAMLLAGEDKWWGDMGERSVPHEGVDIVAYRSASRKVIFLEGSVKLPAMYDGRVAAIIPDYLGESVFIKHRQYRQDNLTFYTVFGHTTLDEGIQPGSSVKEGKVIGTIAPAGRSRSVRPHLHISAMWIPDALVPEVFDWSVIGTSPEIRLVDPLDLIGLPFSVVGHIG